MKQKTYGDIFLLDALEYSNEKIESIGFSNRTYNRLNRAGIESVSDLLHQTPEDLMNIPGFGVSCQNEIREYFTSRSKEAEEQRRIFAESEVGQLRKYRKQIFEGDFSFENLLPESMKGSLQPYKEAHRCLDSFLIEKCERDPEVVLSMCKGFTRFDRAIRKMTEYENRIGRVRLQCQVRPFIIAFTGKEDLREILLSICDEGFMTLEDYIVFFFSMQRSLQDREYEFWIEKFIQWCAFSIEEDLERFFDQLKKKERDYEVLKLRAERKTLESIGDSFGVTRERIRQIESKVIKKFMSWQRNNKLLLKISALRNGDYILTPIELKAYFGDEASILLYLCKNSTTGEVIYDSSLDVFIIGDRSMVEQIQEHVDTLPDTFNEDQLRLLIHRGTDEKGLSEELLDKAIHESYEKTGTIYHRSRLTLEKIYADILERFYPEGMHVYDPEELERFKELVRQEYHMEIENSNRSISAILARIGILCDRGKYRLKDRTFISDKLALRIRDYIDSEDAPIFMTNTIFSVFERELVSENITNKYFLQGILHHLYGDRWIFRRDYISKDESLTSLYTSIVEFIKNADVPVSREDIGIAFPGVTDIVVSLAIGDPNILNLFGIYIYSSKLSLSKADFEYLHRTVEEDLEREHILHCKSIYEKIHSDYPDLLKNNYINHAFSMYSLLEYLFREEYHFSRPFVAKKGVSIEKVHDVLKEIVTEADLIEIEEIRLFAKKYHHSIYSILEFIDELNETHFLINNAELERIECIGIDEDTVKTIDHILMTEVIDTIPISQLRSVHMFPVVRKKWDEWLIYSAMKRWSTRFEVAPSSNQFRLSVPLIAPIGKLDITKQIKEI